MGDSAISERFSSRNYGDSAIFCSVVIARYSCVTIRLIWLDAADSLCLRLASCFYELANSFSCRRSPLVSLYFTSSSLPRPSGLSMMIVSRGDNFDGMSPYLVCCESSDLFVFVSRLLRFFRPLRKLKLKFSVERFAWPPIDSKRPFSSSSGLSMIFSKRAGLLFGPVMLRYILLRGIFGLGANRSYKKTLASFYSISLYIYVRIFSVASVSAKYLVFLVRSGDGGPPCDRNLPVLLELLLSFSSLLCCSDMVLLTTFIRLLVEGPLSTSLVIPHSLVFLFNVCCVVLYSTRGEFFSLKVGSSSVSFCSVLSRMRNFCSSIGACRSCTSA